MPEIIFTDVAPIAREYGGAARRERFVEPIGTRLLYADIPAIRSDLTHAGLAGDVAAHDLRRWLKDAGSVLSLPNARTNSVNGIPRCSGRARTGLRPPRYGRAAVFDAPISVLKAAGIAVDVKGCGVPSGTTPSQKRRFIGTLLLHEALQELLNARLLTEIFRRARVDVTCLPIYGIVDLAITGWCPYLEEEVPCVTMIRVRISGHTVTMSSLPRVAKRSWPSIGSSSSSADSAFRQRQGRAHHPVTLVNDRPFNWGRFVREGGAEYAQPDQGDRLDHAVVGPLPMPQALADDIRFVSSINVRHPGSELAAMRMAIDLRAGKLEHRNLPGAIDDFVRIAAPRPGAKPSESSK